MPRTAILYARSSRREQLDRQVRELEDWCDRAGVIPLDTVVEVAFGARTSKRCWEILANIAAGHADLMLIRDVSRLSESPDQLREIITEHQRRIAICRDDANHFW